jgi:hypothetical protein
MTAPICPKCRTPARLTRGAEVYPHRLDLREKPFWLCDGCGAFCGCHPNTTRSLGSPADAETRNLPQQAASEYDRPSVVFKPKLSRDGNEWCALYGENLAEGCAGFGDSPAAAMWAFDSAWLQKTKPAT